MNESGVVLNPLEILLARSDELSESIFHRLDDSEFFDSPRAEASVRMCRVSLEHWLGLRVLISAGCETSAVSLMRLQFEALTRAMWLLYAASDQAITKLSAPLTLESEHSAKSLPGLNQMIEAIGKCVGSTAPARAHEMLCSFRDVQLKALNSFVHGGIHSLRRHADGFPSSLIMQVLRSSNALAAMGGMTLAVLTADELVAKSMGGIQFEFQDCLPELVH